jgi:hypothetical protein
MTSASRGIITPVAEEIPTTDLAIPFRWPGIEETPILTANQFLLQIDPVGTEPDLMILTVGQATPPAVVGTPDQQLRRLQEIESVDVRVLARYSVTSRRLKELVDALKKVQAVFDSGTVSGPVSGPRTEDAS